MKRDIIKKKRENEKKCITFEYECKLFAFRFENLLRIRENSFSIW